MTRPLRDAAAGALPLPAVRRIPAGLLSTVRPPLNPGWTELAKLRWHLAVVLHDAVADPAGWDVRAAGLTPRLGGGHVQAFTVHHPSGEVAGGGGFHWAWAVITGVGLGLRAGAR